MIDSHQRADRVAIRSGPDQSKPDAAVFFQLIVAVQIRGPVVGGHQQIKIAITIEISVGQAAPDFGCGEVRADLTGNVSKGPLAIVEEQLRWLRVTDIADIAHRVVDMAVDHGQVQKSVEIGIEKDASEAEAAFRRKSNPAGDRGVGKARIAGPVQAYHFIVKVGNRNPGLAGIVEIGRVHAHTSAGFPLRAESYAAFDRDILERPVALIAVELVRSISPSRS